MRVGVIGYGGRVSSMLEILFQYDLGVELAAIMDTDFEAVKKILKEYGRDESRIAFYEDAAEMLIAGAAAVQVGAANFRDPFAMPKIIDGLAAFAQSQKLSSITELTGTLQEWT